MNAITPISASTDLPDGIYFGLPDDEYFAIPRLSASGIKTLCVSPLDFWSDSWMNPDREPDEDTPAKALGRAYHKLLLEGEEAFDACYGVLPDKADYPDALDGAEALRTHCESLGLKKGGSIAELCERIREADAVVQLWPEIIAGFRDQLAGREILKKEQWKDIQRIRFVLQHMPSIRQAFSNGKPEVTILWSDKGVRLKARLDYLKPRKDEAGMLDIKSFGNIMGKRIEEVPATEIARNSYFIQPVLYSAARKAARKMWAAQGQACVTTIAGEEPDKEWLDAVLKPERQSFHFVFVQTGRVPNIIARGFSSLRDFGGMTLQPNEYWRRGQAEITYGVQLFRKCMEHYGTDRPWAADYGVKDLIDEDFPIWSLSSPHPMIDDEVPNV